MLRMLVEVYIYSSFSYWVWYSSSGMDQRICIFFSLLKLKYS